MLFALFVCMKFSRKKKKRSLKLSGYSNNKRMLLSKCNICGSKKSRFIKAKEASGLSSLDLKTT